MLKVDGEEVLLHRDPHLVLGKEIQQFVVHPLGFPVGAGLGFTAFGAGILYAGYVSLSVSVFLGVVEFLFGGVLLYSGIGFLNDFFKYAAHNAANQITTYGVDEVRITSTKGARTLSFGEALDDDTLRPRGLLANLLRAREVLVGEPADADRRLALEFAALHGPLSHPNAAVVLDPKPRVIAGANAHAAAAKVAAKGFAAFTLATTQDGQDELGERDYQPKWGRKVMTPIT
ncbi:MAG: hypothetical protein AAGE52_25560 [Myxococcota bacterium]